MQCYNLVNQKIIKSVTLTGVYAKFKRKGEEENGYKQLIKSKKRGLCTNYY